jgi:hypothetical protein
MLSLIRLFLARSPTKVRNMRQLYCIRRAYPYVRIETRKALRGFPGNATLLSSSTMGGHIPGRINIAQQRTLT